MIHDDAATIVDNYLVKLVRSNVLCSYAIDVQCTL